jgi:hypothetical protein
MKRVARVPSAAIPLCLLLSCNALAQEPPGVEMFSPQGGESADAILTAVPLDGFPKRVAGQTGQQLGENGGSLVHGHSPPRNGFGGIAGSTPILTGQH